MSSCFTGGRLRPLALSVALTLLTLSVEVAAAGSALATFPGINGKIAFYLYPHGRRPSAAIVAIGPDGSHRQRLTQLSGPSRELPAWSPTGTRIAYAVVGNHETSIATMNASGTDRTVVLPRLPHGYDQVGDIDWSPDGQKILFTALTDGKANIFVVDTDGTHLTDLTIGNHFDTYAVWSTDGSKIAFVTLPPPYEVQAIGVMTPNGSHRTLIVPTGFNDFPSWSPNSTSIVFSRLAGRPVKHVRYYDVFSVGSDGAGLTQLTHTAQRDESHPVFSPDGASIAFSRSQGPSLASSDDLWIMKADGSHQVRITHTKRRDEFWATWQAT